MRKFYKTVLTVTIISDEPYEYYDLDHVHYDITRGDCSGEVEVESCEITAKQAAELLIKQGSEPGFLFLDENGNEI